MAAKKTTKKLASQAKEEKSTDKAGVDIDFGFYKYLFDVYVANKGTIRSSYRDLTKKYLDFNDAEKNPGAFLRKPQFEALEMYVFFKEYLENAPVYQVFKDWYQRSGPFERLRYDTHRQWELFGELDDAGYEKVFKEMEQHHLPYSNYIFALTMGTGKTILMATCIFYEFLLANKFPKDEKYCHNAIVFAPDRTVLESLREIESFDKTRVIPKEYVNVIESNIRIAYLVESGATLNVLDKSAFNLIVSNVQKIILKRSQKADSKAAELFKAEKNNYQVSGAYADARKLLDEDIGDEDDLKTNQRFQKLLRLEQLGIYLDEAHHAYGTSLQKDLSNDPAKASALRLTINELAHKLEESGTRVVACFNYTGTPYVGKKVLPDVIYAFGLKEAIDDEYLKKVKLTGYNHPKSKEFLKIVIQDFWQNYGENRYEGMLPKLAIFSPTIEELEKEVRPAVEKILSNLGVPTNKILINVGDEKITTNADIYEFNRLDTIGSEKQFLLLVNKGKEGWNCRSLFGVALYREPKSKIFVLQASMRCLRSIDPKQQTGSVYLSSENLAILDKELEANYRLSVDRLNNSGSKKKAYQVRVTEPPRKITIKRTKKLFKADINSREGRLSLDLKEIDFEKYRITAITRDSLQKEEKARESDSIDLTHIRENREFTELSLVSELAMYLHRSPLEVEEILAESKDGLDLILTTVNRYNGVLYDHIIPSFFRYLYKLTEFKHEDEIEVELVKHPPEGFYTVSGDPAKTLELKKEPWSKYQAKSFHLDTYCFDSTPEKLFFEEIVKNERAEELYFTGMLTHGQSDFNIQYIDPETHALRSYYPDFVIKEKDEKLHIVEVKGDNKLDDSVVRAKEEYARQLAGERLSYKVIAGSQVNAGESHLVFENQDVITDSLAKRMGSLNEEQQGSLLLLSFIEDYRQRQFRDALPVYSLKAACGKFGADQSVEERGWVEVSGRKLTEDMFIIQAVGRSMEPTIADGDYCIFRSNPKGSLNGKILLVEYRGIDSSETGGHYTIKRYRSEKSDSESDGLIKKITLEPVNHDFEPIVLENKDEYFDSEFRVVGEFIDVLRND